MIFTLFVYPEYGCNDFDHLLEVKDYIGIDEENKWYEIYVSY